MSKNPVILNQLELGKLVHGGQSISETKNGKKILVWGGLPDEVVDVRITKKKSSYLEGVVENVVKSSEFRIEPKEPKSFLSTSPWQVMEYDFENKSKQAILEETFEREGVEIEWDEFKFEDQQYGYRNKLEIGFWGDDDGLHLAHYVRGSHGKVTSENNALVKDCINVAARDVCSELNKLDIWAGKLKTLILRCNKENQVVGAVFLKEEIDFSQFKLPKSLKGLDIYFSNPKSPASVPTKLLRGLGDTNLTDEIVGHKIEYNVLSFFQVNLEIFEKALSRIKKYVSDEKSVDMYSGVGTIGIAVGSEILVESDEQNIKTIKLNSKNAEVVHAPSEKALEYVDPENILIVDPPRAGLHKDLVSKLLQVLPPKIIYLSCNPSTQSRDVKLLSEKYKISFAQGFNFFPRTPHIESLILLTREIND